MDLSTRLLASSGSHGSMESSSRNLHSSTRINAATAVMGFVMEAIRKNFVVMAHERSAPWHFFPFDVSRQHPPHSFQTWLRKTCGAHV
jgi:hypothetical protein